VFCVIWRPTATPDATELELEAEPVAAAADGVLPAPLLELHAATTKAMATTAMTTQ
jgi:hypothetical protein